MIDQESQAMNTLLSQNFSFQRLHSKHRELKSRVEQVHEGSLQLSGMPLEALKKQKLAVKDKMAKMVSDYLNRQAVA